MSPARATVAILLLLIIASPASAQMFVTTGKDALRGLPGVEVVVDELPDDFPSKELTVPGLQAAIEARLRKADITVFTSHQTNTSDAKPYLYVLLSGFEIPGQGLYVMHVQVQVRQVVRSVVTSSSIVDAVTWDSHAVIGVPVKSLPAVAGEVFDHVDRFARDWAATR